MTEQRDHELLRRHREASKSLDVVSLWPRLVEFTGLSEYEAKVYLCLVGLGYSSARKVSRFCDVPRTKIYDTLKKLIDAGLVVEIPGSPKRFVSIAPEDAFSAFLNIARKKALDFTNIINNLEESYRSVRSESRLLEKSVWYLDDDGDTKRKLKEIIRKTKRSATILTNADGLSMIFNLAHKLLDELQERGVEVKLYSPLDPRTNPLARELSYLFEVKKIEVDTLLFFMESDHMHFLLTKIGMQDEQITLAPAIFSDDPTLLSLISLLLINQSRNKAIKANSIIKNNLNGI